MAGHGLSAADLAQKISLSRSPAPPGDSAYAAYANSFKASGGDASTLRAPRPRLQRRPSMSFATDTGFNSYSGFLGAGWYAESQSARFRQAVIAEFYATTVFVAIGSIAVMFTATEGPLGASVVTLYGTLNQQAQASALGDLTLTLGSPRLGLISLVFGFMISILVFSTGAISGGNINPAVTVSLFLTGKMSALRCTCYVLAQCLGAVMGAAWARSLSPPLFDAANGAANAVSSAKWVGTWTVLGGEMLGTALLVLTVVTASDVGRERSNKYVGALTPLCIGLSVLVAHLFLIPIDGCSINPARSFGSAVVAGGNAWKDHWMFWVGPMVGGPGLALGYQYVFSTGITLAPAPGPRAGSVAGGAVGSGHSEDQMIREQERRDSFDRESGPQAFTATGAADEGTLPTRAPIQLAASVAESVASQAAAAIRKSLVRLRREPSSSLSPTSAAQGGLSSVREDEDDHEESSAARSPRHV